MVTKKVRKRDCKNMKLIGVNTDIISNGPKSYYISTINAILKIAKSVDIDVSTFSNDVSDLSADEVLDVMYDLRRYLRNCLPNPDDNKLTIQTCNTLIKSYAKVSVIKSCIRMIGEVKAITHMLQENPSKVEVIL